MGRLPASCVPFKCTLSPLVFLSLREEKDPVHTCERVGKGVGRWRRGDEISGFKKSLNGVSAGKTRKGPRKNVMSERSNFYCCVCFFIFCFWLERGCRGRSRLGRQGRDGRKWTLNRKTQTREKGVRNTTTQIVWAVRLVTGWIGQLTNNIR